MLGNRETRLTAILLCVAIVTTILFSEMVGANKVNFLVTAVFVCLAAFVIINEKKPVAIRPELVIFAVFIVYAIVPSLMAVDTGAALTRVIVLLQLLLLVLLATNVMVWQGSTYIFALAYVGAAVLSYSASLTGFGFGLIDTVQLQELNAEDRVTGTVSNANKFGTLMVQAQLAALIASMQTNRRIVKVGLAFAFVLFTVAIVNSGSRTALVGMLVMFCGLFWVFRLWRIRNFLIASVFLSVLVVGLLGSYVALKDDGQVRARVESFLSNEHLIGRYKNLIALFSTKGDLGALPSSEGSIHGRMELARTAVKVVVYDEPFGMGLDNFSTITGAYAHSNYLEILATTGWIGLVLYVAIYLSVLVRSRQLFPAARGQDLLLLRTLILGVGVLMVMDLASCRYYQKPYWLLLAIVIGTLEIQRRKLTQTAPDAGTALSGTPHRIEPRLV
jgi:O-antigen ligase